MREKGPKLRIILAFEAFDLQMAIKQILLRSGWEETSMGKIVRKVKQALSNTPKLYILDIAKDGKMMVRDREGRVSARVDLSQITTKEQILEAARILNNGAVKTVYAAADHYRNTCPECKEVSQCRCNGDKVETHNVCYSCTQKAEGCMDSKKIAKVASALKEAAGLGHYGASNVRDYFRTELSKSDTVTHQASGLKAKKTVKGSKTEYTLSRPNGQTFRAADLETLAEQASQWADTARRNK